MRMRTPITLSTLLVLFCCLGVAVETRAQAVTGYTEIDYYADTDTLDAYSETDMDEDLIGEYDAYVSLTIRDGNFSVVASGSEEDQWNGVASVELFYSGTTPDTTYTARGFHKPIADMWDYDYAWPYQTYAPISVGSTYDSDSVSTPAGPPDHLLLGNDLIGSTGCSGVRRQIDYVVVDSNKHIKRNISVVEDPGGAKTDSCSNLNVVFSTSCFQISAIFEDDLKTGCPGSGSCGFDVPTDKWKWCNGTTPPTLATLNYSVHYNQINVDGRPTKYPDKTEFFPDGSVHIPQ